MDSKLLNLKHLEFIIIITILYKDVDAPHCMPFIF